MTNDELAAIKARAEAATPGLWAKVTDEDGYLLVMSEKENICGFGDMEEVEKQDFDNAAFIAYARTDIPALIAEVERLQVIEQATKAFLEAYSPDRYRAFNDLRLTMGYTYTYVT